MNSHKTIIRVASNSHAGGSIMLNSYSLDGVLAVKNQNEEQTVYLFQYNDAYTHSCKDHCTFKSFEDNTKKEYTKSVMANIRKLAAIIKEIVNQYNGNDKLNIKVVDSSNCDYDHHPIPPHPDDELVEAKKKYHYDDFLHKILSRELMGFLGKIY